MPRSPARRIPIAWRNLSEHPWRLAASVAGVAFAVVLMFLENGFRNALLDNMVAVARNLNGDLIVTHRSRYILSQAMPFPAGRLELIAGVSGIESVHRFYLDVHVSRRWRDPATGQTRPIRLIAFRPEDDLLDLAEVRAQRSLWDAPETALADTRSKTAIYGPIAPGMVSELGGRRIRIVGRFTLGTDFRSNGTLLLSERNFLRYNPGRDRGKPGERLIDLGVVRVDSDVSLPEMQEKLARRLPPDCIVLTKAQLLRKEQHFWARVTPVGIVFDIGVVMGFLVGLAVCYQILFSEIHDRLAQFATLKAMGYGQRRLLAVIVAEGLWLAVLGFAVGWVVSAGLYLLLGSLTGMSLAWKLDQIVGILAITVAMCVLAAGLAARRLQRVDPAELFT
jgi:putative ABC transport system permease protein